MMVNGDSHETTVGISTVKILLSSQTALSLLYFICAITWDIDFPYNTMVLNKIELVEYTFAVLFKIAGRSDLSTSSMLLESLIIGIFSVFA